MFPTQTYIERRQRLQQTLGGGLVLMLGNGIASYNYPDNNYPFRQDSTFLYFFGLDYEGLAAIIDIDNDQTIVFGDELTIDDIIWSGVQPTLAERSLAVGVAETRPMSTLCKYIELALEKRQPIHFVPPYRGHTILWLEQLLGTKVSTKPGDAFLKGMPVATPSLELCYNIADMRNHKSPEELEQLAEAVDITVTMHETAMRIVKPGMHEKDIAAAVGEVCQRLGYFFSFPTICTNHGETLHNHGYIHQLREGDMLLLDAGAENAMHYAGDCTTTMPVGREFTERQKAVYRVLIDTYEKAAAMLRPGITYRECHVAAWANIAAGLKELGIMKGDPMEAAEAGAVAMFMPHGLGHMMGLDVHDMEDLGQINVGYDEEVQPIKIFGVASLRMGKRLQEGNVLTNEPGIYFVPQLIDIWEREHKFEQFINYAEVDKYRDFGGIRLEDDILITPTGSRIVGDRRIPIEIKDVEDFMK